MTSIPLLPVHIREVTILYISAQFNIDKTILTVIIPSIHPPPRRLMQAIRLDAPVFFFVGIIYISQTHFLISYSGVWCTSI